MKRFASLAVSKFWLFGPVCGLAAAAVATLVFTVWDWASNPGGIFRDEAGTNWQFVYETATSWFIPTFLYVAVLAALLHLCVSGVRSLRKRDSD